MSVDDALKYIISMGVVSPSRRASAPHGIPEAAPEASRAFAAHPRN
jgi:uncharacterized membrane protein